MAPPVPERETLYDKGGLITRGEVWVGRVLGPRIKMARERIPGAHTGQ